MSLDVDINTLRAAITVLSLMAFVGIVIWAYSGRRAEDFERAARLPLEQD